MATVEMTASRDYARMMRYVIGRLRRATNLHELLSKVKSQKSKACACEFVLTVS
jgi:hypothetical protein